MIFFCFFSSKKKRRRPSEGLRFPRKLTVFSFQKEKKVQNSFVSSADSSLCLRMYSLHLMYP